MTPNKAIDKLLKDNGMTKTRLASLMGKSMNYATKTLMNPTPNIKTVMEMLALIGDGYELAVQKSDKRIKRGEQIVLDMNGEDSK